MHERPGVVGHRPGDVEDEDDLAPADTPLPPVLIDDLAMAAHGRPDGLAEVGTDAAVVRDRAAGAALGGKELELLHQLAQRRLLLVGHLGEALVPQHLHVRAHESAGGVELLLLAGLRLGQHLELRLGLGIEVHLHLEHVLERTVVGEKVRPEHLVVDRLVDMTGEHRCLARVVEVEQLRGVEQGHGVGVAEDGPGPDDDPLVAQGAAKPDEDGEQALVCRH